MFSYYKSYSHRRIIYINHRIIYITTSTIDGGQVIHMYTVISENRFIDMLTITEFDKCTPSHRGNNCVRAP